MVHIKMYQELQSIDGKRKYEGLSMLSVVRVVSLRSENLIQSNTLHKNLRILTPVEDGEESTSAHLLESAVASSSSDEYYLQESDAFVFTDNCCSNSCAWFLNESESTTFEEPALFANEKSKEDQTTTFADDFFEEIEIPEEEIEINRDKSEDPLVKYAEKPLYTGSRLTRHQYVVDCNLCN